MNAKLSSPSLLLTALLCLGLGSVQAQNPSVPSYINYQGSVTDSNGLPLGANGTVQDPVAEPTNYKVIFRIYDSATGPANLLWTEEQTVTISLGQFSVLLGRGIQFGSDDHDSIESVFTRNDGGSPKGPQRFLSITVDNGDNTLDDSDVEISPRQQITTTAYSFRAGTADSVASGSSLLLGNSADNGLGYYGTGRTFNSTEIGGPVLYGLSGGALGSVTGTTQKTALRWNDNSQVGIGTSTLSNAAAGTKLVLQGDDSSFPPAQLSIRGNSDTDKRLLMGYNTASNYGNIQALNGNTFSKLYLNRDGGDISLGNNTSSTEAKGGFKAPFNYSVNAGYSFIGDLDTGMYRISSNNLGFYTGGQKRMAINSSGQLFPFHGVFAPVSYGSSNGYSFDGDSDTGMYRPATNQLSFHSGGVERMRINAQGRVGIGTASPSAYLHVERLNSEIASIYATGPKQGGQGSGVVYVGQSLSHGGGMSYDGDGTPELVGGTDRITFSRRTGGVDHDVFSYGYNSDDVRFQGNVGIGAAPTKARLSVWGGPSKSGIRGSYINGSTAAGAVVHGVHNISLFTEHSIWCNNTVIASSDRRIKDIEGKSDGSKDLQALLGIDITDYRYKDQINHGDTPQKKVIAQQLETIFPQAVSRQTNVIPDIYEKATILEDGWIELATDLKKGERVRLIATENDEILEVLEVEEKRFRTDFIPEEGEEFLFVYGREVKDFRVVDYDAIAMLNVSATQELARQLEVKDTEIKKLQEENASLRASFAAQERQISAQNARDNSLEAKLAAIEKTLSALKPGKRTASLSKSRAAE